MRVDLYLALVLKMAAGIYAIQSPGVPVSYDRATAYALSATRHALARGVDPFELAGVARNESDFIENMRGPDGKDCGLTQTRITITKYTCRQLRRSYDLAFAEGARELAEYDRACAARPDRNRCRLNRYNSGVRYARHGFHGNYWLRVTCFAQAAQAGLDVGQACRHVEGRGDIRRVLAHSVHRVHPVLVAGELPSS
jgi:hypothetical protein